MLLMKYFSKTSCHFVGEIEIQTTVKCTKCVWQKNPWVDMKTESSLWLFELIANDTGLDCARKYRAWELVFVMTTTLL